MLVGTTKGGAAEALPVPVLQLYRWPWVAMARQVNHRPPLSGAAHHPPRAPPTGLCVLTVGQPNERGFKELQSDLERSGKHGKSVAAQAAALAALAVTCWVMAEDDGTTQATMQVRRRCLFGAALENCTVRICC